ncbi:MAG: acyltransferase family protein [Muribaculaceae bacterium]|nr:acyltransferase family protein [Muribaculaceae bacterium]
MHKKTEVVYSLDKEKSISKRMFEFDLLKCFAIFLVICGHSIMHLTDDNKNSNLLYQLIYSFHMPLFMTVAGFFCTNSMNLSFSKFVKKKLWQLLYPCLIFGILFFLLEVIFLNRATGSLLKYLFASFWFLKSCFICYLVLYICLKICNNRILGGTILAIFLSQFIPIFKLPFMMPFFVLGYILNSKWESFTSHKHKLFWISVCLFIPIFYIYINTDVIDIVDIKKRIINEGEIISIKEYLSYHSLRLIIGLIGTIVCLTLFNLIAPHIKQFKISGYLSKVGEETLGIYILQTIILEVFLSKYVNITHVSPYLFNLLIVPIISLVILMLSILIIKTINRNIIIKKLFWGK